MVRSFLAICLLVSVFSFAQAPITSAAIIAAHENDVAELAMLQGFDLRRGKWTHKAVDVCPAFASHIFARYDLAPTVGLKMSFIAAYPTGAEVHTRRSWENGIVIFPLEGGGKDRTPIVERKGTLVGFNHIWSAELKMPGSVGDIPRVSRAELAACYARVAGLEVPVQKSENPATPPFDATPLPSNAQIRLMPPLISLSVSFDRYGFITDPKLNGSPSWRLGTEHVGSEH